MLVGLTEILMLMSIICWDIFIAVLSNVITGFFSTPFFIYWYYCCCLPIFWESFLFLILLNNFRSTAVLACPIYLIMSEFTLSYFDAFPLFNFLCNVCISSIANSISILVHCFHRSLTHYLDHFRSLTVSEISIWVCTVYLFSVST